MNVIALASYGTTLSVSLQCSSGYLEAVRTTGLRHNQNILPLLSELTRDADFDMKDTDLVAATLGPGSFTALRIILSTAKGLAAAGNAPLVTVPTFDLYGSWYAAWPGTVVPVLDGRKNRFYSAFYQSGKKIEPEHDESAEILRDRIRNRRPVLVVGDDSLNLFPYNDIEEDIEIIPYCELPGRHLIRTGIRMVKNGCISDKSVSPLYIRKSDAELERNV